MSSVSRLKDKARDFERKEDWGKAVDAYLLVIKATEKEASEAELSLYNRVGDLYLRLGRPSDAVDYYSKAADHYGEAGLYNNAIALCNKALRYQPDRLELYRKLGKLSAEQGFITDARRWYLEYAERLAKQGKTQEAFEALKEFAGLSEDPEIREMLAAQLEQRGEIEDAVKQLRLAYTHYLEQPGGAAKVSELRKHIYTLDPSLEGTDITLTTDGSPASHTSDLPGMIIDRGATAAPKSAPPAETLAVDQDFGMGAGSATDDATEVEPLPGFDDPTEASDALEGMELPDLMSTDMGLGDQEILAADLPPLDIEQGASLVDEDEEGSTGFDLPTLDDTEEIGTIDAEGLTGLEGFGEVETAEEEPAEDELPMLVDDLMETEEEIEPLPSLEVDLGEPAVEEEEEEEEEDEEPVAAELQEEEEADEPVGAELADAGVELDLPEAEAAEEEDVEEEDVEEEAEIGVALDEVIVDAPSDAEEVEPIAAEVEPVEAEDEEEEEEVETEIEEVEEAGARPTAPAAVAVAGEDVETLIESARDRFEGGERREALASLNAQHVNLADANRLADAYRVAEALIELDPDAVEAHQARVEYAFRLDDRTRLVEAYLDFAACLRRTGAEAKSKSVYQRVLEIDAKNAAARSALAEPAPHATAASKKAETEFVDLGGMLMDDEHEQTTRFVVAETVESGDEERDFADMLTQFRAKVAQHVPQEDTESHYDLGIAFKEMGLVDEAISEFQIALRGGNERLKVYEELGQCFMQKGQYNIAAKLLARGAQLPASDDAELLGVYYLLGRCYEELGQTTEAKEAFERVLGLDIDFRDVNQRLSRL